MKRWEVWEASGSKVTLAGSYEDRQRVDRCMRALTAGCLAHGPDVLAFVVGTPAGARQLLRAAVAAAHPSEAKMILPSPGNTDHVAAREEHITRRHAPDDEGDEARCVVEGCAHVPTIKGYCTKHWSRRLGGSGGVGASLAPRLPVTAPTLPPSEAPVPPMESEPADLAPRCRARGCTELRAGVRANTPAWREGYCRRHRDSGRHAIGAGRATEATIGAYFDEMRDRSTAVRLAYSAPPAPIVSDPAVELSSETVKVTVRLPDDQVRARRCADAVGLVALEALATLRADSSHADVARVLAQLPARGGL